MIEFIPEGHIYINDGIIVPSVTQILSFILNLKLSNIPQETLKAKAEFGTAIHKAIEIGSDKGLSPIAKISYEEWLKLKETYHIYPAQQEQMITYKGLYCGTYDMIGDVNYTRSLLDIKTTYELNTEYLEWQLGMYKMAINQEKELVKDCYCIWLPKKDKGQLVKIYPKKEKEILKALKDYEEHYTE